MASKAKSKVKAIPDGHRTVTPYLAVKGAAKALEFYKRAFGATETYRLMMPDGRVGHAEIRLGDSLIMLSDEFPEFGGKAPDPLGGNAGEPAPVRRGRGRVRQASAGGWRHRAQAGDGPVLRRPLRAARGHPQGGRPAG